MEQRKPIPPLEAESPFKVGDAVAMRSFSDCFNDHHKRIDGLTVEAVMLYPGYSIPSYWRITAAGRSGRVEGGSQFFEPSP